MGGTGGRGEMIPVRAPSGFGVIFSNAGYSGLLGCHFYGRAIGWDEPKIYQAAAVRSSEVWQRGGKEVWLT